MHLQLRTVAVLAAVLLGALVSGWGIAASLRPTLWSRRAVRWCVGWTPEPVGRTFGVAVAVFGAGIAVSGVAGALMPLGEAIPPIARFIETAGLGLVVLGGVALVITTPAPVGEIERHGPAASHTNPDRDTSVPPPAVPSGDVDAAPVDRSADRDAVTL